MAWLSSCLLFACADLAGDTGPKVKYENRKVAGPVVATVDGDPISLAEVQELVDATGLSPREALDRLEQERLLARYAEERGYGQDAASARALKGARARAMLAVAVEADTRPDSIPMTEVMARFEELRKRDAKPESRSVVHVLFRTEDGKRIPEAKAAAEAFLREARNRPSLDDQVALLNEVPASGERDGLQVVRESFDATEDGKLEKPFESAVFENLGVGLVPKIAQTSYGFHVIVVRSLNPPFDPPLANYEATIRKDLSFDKRKVALEKLVEALKLKDPVVFDEALVKRAMADETLLGKNP